MEEKVRRPIITLDKNGKYIWVTLFVDPDVGSAQKILYNERVIEKYLGNDLEFMVIKGNYKKRFDRMYKSCENKEMLVNFELLKIYYKGVGIIESD